MSRSFRSTPPEPRPDLLTRPRLLRALTGRWQHRVTSLVGGPGLGKTTLLAQAIAENRLAPRGEDMWVGVEARDADAERLARIVAAAVRGDDDQDTERARGDAVIEPGVVADSVWRLAPTEACLVLDDVHLLPAESTGAAWLTDLVRALPANGHVVFGSRSEPPVPLSRFGAQGAMLRLVEDDLRFSDEELSTFAVSRGFDPAHFGETGGWPAMAELAAHVEEQFTGSYLWEEVLQPLGTLRRHVLAVLSDLGGADDELMSAAVGTPVELATMLEGIPLVARGADGWHRPHSLWHSAPNLVLAASERIEIRRRAVANLNRRGRFDEAFGLIQDAELWDAAPSVLRAACLATDRLVPSQLGRWLLASSPAVRASSAGRLAAGLHVAFTAPALAVAPLQEAATRSRDEGDLDAELAAIAQLGQLAWWRQDHEALGELVGRLFELEPTGHPVARALAAIARGALYDLAGDDGGVLAELDGMATGILDTVWDAYAGWMCGVVHLDTGTPAATERIVERLTPAADEATRPIVDSLQFRAWWAEGRADEALARIPVVVSAEVQSGPTYNFHIGQIFASVAFSYAGDRDTARRYLDDARLTAPPPEPGSAVGEGGEDGAGDGPSVPVAAATASLQLAEGDEDAAAATLRQAAAANGFDQGGERRSWRQTLAVSYVLLPESRAHWDATARQGYPGRARELAAAVVALREGNGEARLASLELPEEGAIRTVLHHRLAAELAVGLAAVGRPAGRRLLDTLGPAGRTAVRNLAQTRPDQAKAARALLAAVPVPPPHITYLGVLGPLSLRRDHPDGDEIVHPDLRRSRLQALLGFLVARRRTTRAAIGAALWPDLDEAAAGNNLSVTLNHLLRLLEPWRDAGEPSFLVRVDGPAVQLANGPHLVVDVDRFDRHVADALAAEADGAPSVALEHHLAAVELYRDHLHADLPEADWFALEREHYRTRFVAAAVRAGELLLGHGDIARAEPVAHRALAADPWSEQAYAVLVGAALARGDRSGARRLLDRCLDALADLRAQPSLATEQLRRRVLGDAA
ncbi:MAG TPA: BTAD domain-containing putative transcriptional regulator [Acidimicrobiales bacterium]|nr:BTAD domain-containing putative transcriptional regulator [Acidimicrobiales bacterium]